MHIESVRNFSVLCHFTSLVFVNLCKSNYKTFGDKLSFLNNKIIAVKFVNLRLILVIAVLYKSSSAINYAATAFTGAIGKIPNTIKKPQRIT